MPRVGQTTPREMLKLFLLLFNSDWKPEMKSFIREIFGDIYASWFDIYIPLHIKKNLLHKTGSMINIGKYGDTVFNVVGMVDVNSTPFAFSYYSRTKFESKPSEAEIKNLQKNLAQNIVIKLEKQLKNKHRRVKKK